MMREGHLFLHRGKQSWAVLIHQRRRRGLHLRRLGCAWSLGYGKSFLRETLKGLSMGVNSKSVDWSCLDLLLDDIRSELRPIPQWHMQFVGREGNQTAHRLSHMATSRILDEKWFDQPPEGTTDCLVMELQASSFDLSS
jgi:hypothetical protein